MSDTGLKVRLPIVTSRSSSTTLFQVPFSSVPDRSSNLALSVPSNVSARGPVPETQAPSRFTIDRVAQSAVMGTLVCSVTFSVLEAPGHGLVCPIILVVKAGVSTKRGSVCARGCWSPARIVIDLPGAVIWFAGRLRVSYQLRSVLGTVSSLGAKWKPCWPLISIDTAALSRGVIWFLRRKLKWNTAQDAVGTTPHEPEPPGHPSNVSTPAA